MNKTNNLLGNQTEIPTADTLTGTERVLNASSPSNNALLGDLEEVVAIPIAEQSSSIFPTDPTQLPKISTLSELLDLLTAMLIRFDTAPKYYQKPDFKVLTKIISEAFIYLYTDGFQGLNKGIPLIGVAELTTDPLADAIELGNLFPGMYYAKIAGTYIHFGITLSAEDLLNKIILLIPNIIDNVFVDYYVESNDLSLKNAYVYIAYASNDSGTDFTNTFDPTLNYIAIKESNTEIVNPVAIDFIGLWKYYKGEPAIPTTIISETPTGLVNGINTDFTLSNTPISSGAIFFLVNGVKRDITLAGNVCTLGFAPTIGSVIRVTYFKYIDVLAITVSDIINLGSVATHDYNEFVTKVLSPVFTNSTSEIVLNCLNYIQYDNNNGSTDVTIAFDNIPETSGENLLIINNQRAAAFNLILPDDFVSGGINYAIKKMIQSPVYIDNGGSAELNFLRIRKPIENVAVNTIKYGRLYNWYAATDVRGIAPIGWHVPTHDEYQLLLSYLSPLSSIKLRESGAAHWDSPNNATNESLFTALPMGDYIYVNIGEKNEPDVWVWKFVYLGDYVDYLCSTEVDATRAWALQLDLYNDGSLTVPNKTSGVPVRLIKDNSINEGDVIIDGDIYNTVTIGTQVWLQQNLAVTHYQNGDPILSDFNGTVGAVTAYNNDESNVYETTYIEVNECEIRITGGTNV